MMAKTSFGAVFKLHNGSTLTTVSEVFSVSPPQQSRATIETTAHDTAGGAKTYIGDGTYDPGEITIQGNYVAGSASDDLMLDALADGDVRAFEIVAKAASGTEDIEGSCIVTSYGPDGFEVDGKQTFSATLKVSGALTQGPSA
jgi:predicted secreted protein